MPIDPNFFLSLCIGRDINYYVKILASFTDEKKFPLDLTVTTSWKNEDFVSLLVASFLLQDKCKSQIKNPRKYET
jgi:hypothetical protein